MNFLIDAMFSPAVARNLRSLGHDAISALDLNRGRTADPALIRLAEIEDRVIVTENFGDFAKVSTCPVILALKVWWPSRSLPLRMPTALTKWAAANPDPGLYARWLEAEYR